MASWLLHSSGRECGASLEKAPSHRCSRALLLLLLLLLLVLLLRLRPVVLRPLRDGSPKKKTPRHPHTRVSHFSFNCCMCVSSTQTPLVSNAESNRELRQRQQRSRYTWSTWDEEAPSPQESWPGMLRRAAPGQRSSIFSTLQQRQTRYRQAAGILRGRPPSIRTFGGEPVEILLVVHLARPLRAWLLRLLVANRLALAQRIRKVPTTRNSRRKRKIMEFQRMKGIFSKGLLFKLPPLTV